VVDNPIIHCSSFSLPREKVRMRVIYHIGDQFLMTTKMPISSVKSHG